MAEHMIVSCLHQLQKAVECSICLDTLKDPIETKCGHTFCEKCLYTALGRESSIPCPLCKHAITKRGSRKGNYLASIVSAVNAVHQSSQEDLAEHDEILAKQASLQKRSEQSLPEPTTPAPTNDVSFYAKAQKTPDLLDIVDKLNLQKDEEKKDVAPIPEPSLQIEQPRSDLSSLNQTDTNFNKSPNDNECVSLGEIAEVPDPYAFPISQHQTEMKKTCRRKSRRKSTKGTGFSNDTIGNVTDTKQVKSVKTPKYVAKSSRRTKTDTPQTDRKGSKLKKYPKKIVDDKTNADKEMLEMINDTESHRLTIETDTNLPSNQKLLVENQHVKNDSNPLPVEIITDAFKQFSPPPQLISPVRHLLASKDVPASVHSLPSMEVKKHKDFMNVEDHPEAKQCLPSMEVEKEDREAAASQSDLPSKANIELTTRKESSGEQMEQDHKRTPKLPKKSNGNIQENKANETSSTAEDSPAINNLVGSHPRISRRLLYSETSSASSEPKQEISEVTHIIQQNTNDKVSKWLENVDPQLEHSEADDDAKKTTTEENERESDFEDMTSASQVQTYWPKTVVKHQRLAKILKKLKEHDVVRNAEVFGEDTPKQYIPKTSGHGQMDHFAKPTFRPLPEPSVKQRRPKSLKKITKTIRRLKKTDQKNIFDVNGLSQGVSPFSTPEKETLEKDIRVPVDCTFEIMESCLEKQDFRNKNEESFNETVDFADGNVLADVVKELEDLIGSSETQPEEKEIELVEKSARSVVNITESFQLDQQVEPACSNVSEKLADKEFIKTNGDNLPECPTEHRNQTAAVNSNESPQTIPPFETLPEISPLNAPENSYFLKSNTVHPASNLPQSQATDSTPGLVSTTAVVTVSVHHQPQETTARTMENNSFKTPNNSSPQKIVPKHLNGPVRLESMPITCVAETQDDSAKTTPYYVETPCNSQLLDGDIGNTVNCNNVTTEHLETQVHNKVVSLKKQVTDTERKVDEPSALREMNEPKKEQVLKQNSDDEQSPAKAKIMETCRMVLDELVTTDNETENSHLVVEVLPSQKAFSEIKAPSLIGRNIDLVKVSNELRKEPAVKVIEEIHTTLSQLEKESKDSSEDQNLGEENIDVEGDSKSLSQNDSTSKEDRASTAEEEKSEVYSHYACASSDSLLSENHFSENITSDEFEVKSSANVNNDELEPVSKNTKSVIRQKQMLPVRKSAKHSALKPTLRKRTMPKVLLRSPHKSAKKRKEKILGKQKKPATPTKAPQTSVRKAAIKKRIAPREKSCFSLSSKEDITGGMVTSNGWGGTKLKIRIFRSSSADTDLAEADNTAGIQHSVENVSFTPVHKKKVNSVKKDRNLPVGRYDHNFLSTNLKSNEPVSIQTTIKKSVKNPSSAKTRKVASQGSNFEKISKMTKVVDSPMIIDNFFQYKKATQAHNKEAKPSRIGKQRVSEPAFTSINKSTKSRTKSVDDSSTNDNSQLCSPTRRSKSNHAGLPSSEDHISSTWPQTSTQKQRPVSESDQHICGIVFNELSVVLARLDDSILSEHKNDDQLPKGVDDIIKSQSSEIPCSALFFSQSQRMKRMEDSMEVSAAELITDSGDSSGKRTLEKLHYDQDRNPGNSQLLSPQEALNRLRNPSHQKLLHLLQEMKETTHELGDDVIKAAVIRLEELVFKRCSFSSSASSQSSTMMVCRRQVGRRTKPVLSSLSTENKTPKNCSLQDKEKSLMEDLALSDDSDVKINSSLPPVLLQPAGVTSNPHSLAKSSEKAASFPGSEFAKHADFGNQSHHASKKIIELNRQEIAAASNDLSNPSSARHVDDDHNFPEAIAQETPITFSSQENSQKSDVQCTNESFESNLIPPTQYSRKRTRVLSSSSEEDDSLPSFNPKKSKKPSDVDCDNASAKMEAQSQRHSQDIGSLAMYAESFEEFGPITEKKAEVLCHSSTDRCLNTETMSQQSQINDGHMVELRESPLSPQNSEESSENEEDVDDLPERHHINEGQKLDTLQEVDGENDEFLIKGSQPITESQVPPPTPPPSQPPPPSRKDVSDVDNLLKKISELTRSESGNLEQKQDDYHDQHPAINVNQVTDKSSLSPGQGIRIVKDSFSVVEETLHEDLNSACSSKRHSHKEPMETPLREPLSPKQFGYFDNRINRSDISLNMSKHSPLASSVSFSDRSHSQLDPGGRQLGIMASGLKGKGLSIVKHFAKRYQGKFHDTFVPGKITHLIVKTQDSRCDRTLKYLQAIASKIWIVSIIWVTQSLKQRTLLPEEEFEVLGDNAELESAPSLGPKRARESKDFKLMQGYVAYCFPQFELFTSEQFTELLELCGATVVKKPRDLVRFKQTKSRIIILDPDSFSSTLPNYTELSVRYKAIAVSSSWALDCIGTFSMLSLTKYPVEEDFQSL
ncbi:unnamed protein product [Clavelina lepadiformis]|uniref:Uncharacterized protein n=1 Tax=Clavelina lepadiformis TaxID=159417 RepID=A0ABP0F0W3_CLALP